MLWMSQVTYTFAICFAPTDNCLFLICPQSSFYPECLVLSNDGNRIANGSLTTHMAGHVSTIPCIIVNEQNVYTSEKECLDELSATKSMLYNTTNHTTVDQCPQPKSAPKVRFSE